MIDIKDIAQKLQVPECQKPNHFNEKLCLICLDQNCPDFLKIFCINCQEEHKHKLNSLKNIVNQIVLVANQENQPINNISQANLNSQQLNDQFDFVLKQISLLIGQCQQLYTNVSEAKQQFSYSFKNNTSKINQLLNDLNGQNSEQIQKIMKQIFEYVDLKVQDKIYVSLRQNQSILHQVSEYQGQIQKFIQDTQNHIQDLLKINFKSYLTEYKFLWNAKCEQIMQQSLSQLNQSYQANDARKKWKQVYSTLMKKSGGKRGFCGKETEDFFQGKHDPNPQQTGMMPAIYQQQRQDQYIDYQRIPVQRIIEQVPVQQYQQRCQLQHQHLQKGGFCGQASCDQGFWYCQECWELGEGNNKDN